MIKIFKLMMVHHSVPLLMKLFYSFEHGYKTITHGISFWGEKKRQAEGLFRKPWREKEDPLGHLRFTKDFPLSC